MNYEIIQHVYLTDKHIQTFRTVHKVNNKPTDKPYKLQVTKYPSYEGFYLIHLDINEEEIADTYHETVEDAKKQAEWEFGVSKEEWIT